MDEDVIEKYRQAGAIAAQARRTAKKLCEPGASVEMIANRAEQLIRDEGAKPAFPVNVSLNDEAAHFTPETDDDRTLSEGDVIKIDVGAHIDGYIGDTAVTVDLGNNQKLVDAAAAALQAALDKAGASVEFGRIGAAIQDTIEDHGFKPIRNLGGHGLDQFVQHSGERIPNIRTDSTAVFEPGNAYAIEPFATEGSGAVQDGGPGHIYKYEGGKVRNRTARKLLKQIKRFRGLPFSTRWIDMSPARIKMGMRALVSAGVVREYDILKEQDNGLVSQAEHTILVHKHEIEVTTE